MSKSRPQNAAFDIVGRTNSAIQTPVEPKQQKVGETAALPVVSSNAGGQEKEKKAITESKANPLPLHPPHHPDDEAERGKRQKNLLLFDDQIIALEHLARLEGYNYLSDWARPHFDRLLKEKGLI